jgi:uncharacterized delta-60 repeat protein
MNTGEMTAATRAARTVALRILPASLVTMSIAFSTFLPAPAGAVAADTGTLDRAFGQGGRVVEDFGTEPARDGEAEQGIPTADGGLLVLSRASITKFLPDGSVDRGFGRDGTIVRIEGPIVMTTDSQGRIVVVSSSEDPAGSVTLERFEPDGGLDRSFGAGGSRKVKIARNRMGSIKALLTQADGKLLLVGSGYAFTAEKEAIGAIRLLPSGAVDRSYGSDGCASFTLPIAATS